MTAPDRPQGSPAASGPGVTAGTPVAPAGAPPEPAAVRTLRERWPAAVREAGENRGQFRVTIDRGALVEAVRHLRDDPALRFDFLVDLTALDRYGTEPRFRTVYVLRSMSRHEEVVLQCDVPEEDCWAPSLTPLFQVADWLERECFDMFGIAFRGHPDLRRILMPDFFPDHPLRKDFPIQGKMSDQEWAEWVIARAQRPEAPRPAEAPRRSEAR